MMSETYPDDSTKNMELDTPLTKTDGSPKKVGRQRIPPVAYDENDVVMRDIQERMREKRQKRADLSRSRRANITNASLQLKISLRANNRALAKALEEARCESRQDKDTIFELQCALETSQHELRQSYRTIQDLKLEGISLMDLITHFQESESKQRKRIYEVKKLLNDVTGKYLMNTVTLIDKAAGICNTPSLSKGSSFFVPKGSLSEDNFRDTLSVPMEDSEAMSRANIYYKKGCVNNSRETTPEVNDKRDERAKDSSNLNNDTAGLHDHQDTTPNRLSVSGEELKRQSTASNRRSRATFYLDVNEMRQAIVTDTTNRCDTVEETRNVSPSLSSPTSDKDKEGQQSPPPVVPETSPYLHDSSPSLARESKDLAGEVCLEKTDYKETEMELTHRDEGYLHSNDEMIVTSKPEKDDVIITDETGPQSPSVKEEKQKRKVSIKKKSSKGGRASRKIPKKLTGKKVAPKKSGTASESSVFDLSVGESFTKPASPHQNQKSKSEFVQNLSTESEKSEPGENYSSPAGVKSLEEGEGNMECSGQESQELEKEEQIQDCNPKTRRKSRQPHNKAVEKGTLSRTRAPDIYAGMDSTLISSPFTGEERPIHRELKPLSQVLTESSHGTGDVLEESFNALSRKPNFQKKMAKLKQKKRLYDPKKSLDKEFTHTMLNSQTDEEHFHSERGRRRKTSLIKKRQPSGAELGGGEAAKGIADESLNGLLEESWMKDFLNDIEGENQAYCQTSREPKRRSKQTRKTFRVSCRSVTKLKEAESKEEIDNETNAEEERGVNEINTRNERKSRRIARRGTVCLKMKSETVPECSSEETGLEEDGVHGREEDEICESSTKSAKQNTRASIMHIEKERKNAQEKELRVRRRGTFDVKSNDQEYVDEDEDEDEDRYEEERNEDEVDKDIGEEKVNWKKRKSEEISKDSQKTLEEGRKESNKRLKREEGFPDENLDEDGEEIEEVDMKKKSGRKSPVGKKSKKTKSDRGRRKSLEEMKVSDETKADAELVEQSKPEKRSSKRALRTKEDQTNIGKLGKDDAEENKDEMYDLMECDEAGRDETLSPPKKQSEIKGSGFGGENRETKSSKLAKGKNIDHKPSKKTVSKVPRPKKRVILLSESSDDGLSHEESSSSDESSSSKINVKRPSAIPRMRHHSGSEQGANKIKSEKRNIQVKPNLTGKEILGSEMEQEREVEVDGTTSQKEEASGSSDDSKERADERKMDEKETIRNKKQGRALGKKSLQTSHRKSQVTFKDDIERIEKENMFAIDESGDGKPSIPADEPTHEEEVPEETGRRPSRQARTKAAKNLKEPSLGKKLRRGDPFTDTKLLTSPLVKCKKGKKPGKDSMARTALGDTTNVT